MHKKTIAVDIDDVLSLSAEAFARFSNQQWGMQLTAEDYSENFAKAWGVSLKEAHPMAETFLSSGIHGEYDHFEDALPVLRKLGHRFRLIVVTSRRQLLKTITDAWIERQIVYTGFFDNVDENNARKRLKQSKAQLCLALGVNFLIDDRPKHCLAAAECGIEALLFGDYVWNRDILNKPEKLAVVHSWLELERYFDAQG